MSPEIIYENDDFLIINKPAGLVVHSDGKTKEKTLCDWLLENYPEIENIGEPMQIDNEIIKRPGIVHRLDRETSGVMVVVKNQKAFEYFKNTFKNGEVNKTYNAFVFGFVKEDSGKVDAPIGRSKSDFRKWSAQRGARGQMREALTEYKVLARFEDSGEKYSFVELNPKTGRTHQIRVHMKYLNHPIVGDELYGGKVYKGLGFKRTALHARNLRFKDINGEELYFEAPYPEDFIELLTKI